MESLEKIIQLMLEFLKDPFLILHFSYYLLVTFLTMLSVILVSMLMILLSILSVIRRLICGSNLNWLLNLNLIYETLDWGKKSIVDFNAGKTELVLFDQSNNNGSIDVEMDGSVLAEKSSLRNNQDAGVDLFFLNWIGALTLSLLLKVPSRILEL